MNLSRREALIGALGTAMLWSTPGWAQEVPAQTAPTPTQPGTAPTPPASVEVISGYSVNWQDGPKTPALVASLEAQIALITALNIKPEAQSFFAAQPITVDLAPDTGTRVSPTGVTFGRKIWPDDNPVLLHEMLHRYHLLMLPNGYDNPQIVDFYNAAKAAGAYPAHEYMFRDCREFFAMCGSVTLYGKAARQPLIRASVEKNLPDVYAWFVKEFALVI